MERAKGCMSKSEEKLKTTARDTNDHSPGNYPICSWRAGDRLEPVGYVARDRIFEKHAAGRSWLPDVGASRRAGMHTLRQTGGPSPRGRHKSEKNPKVDVRFDPLRNTGHVGDCACVLSRGGWDKMGHCGTPKKDPFGDRANLRGEMSQNVTKCHARKGSYSSSASSRFRIGPPEACTILHRFAPCTYGS